jgi:hypothetical protein
MTLHSLERHSILAHHTDQEPDSAQVALGKVLVASTSSMCLLQALRLTFTSDCSQ